MTVWLAFVGPCLAAFAGARLGRRVARIGAPARFRWSTLGGVAILLPLATLLPLGPSTSAGQQVVATLGLAAAGALLGAFVASGVEFGFVENSFPPSEEVQREVLDRHRARLGEPPPLRPSKRVFDVFVSLGALFLLAPVWVLIGLIIWLEDPGPVVFVKNSVGLGGRTFAQLKFRTMVRNAEGATGPIPARIEDERILRVGRFLRRTALDELPQLLNILAGQMSFVGPRPLRTVVERDLLRLVPEFADRHKVQPGLAGLAQVVASYYVPLRSRLRLDRLYAEKASLLFDLKLIGAAIMIVFWLRWQPGWNGRLPRRWLHGRRRERRAAP